MAATARAVLAMKAQQKKLEALKLAQQNTDILDGEQRAHLLHLLANEDATHFIANLAQGKIPNDQDDADCRKSNFDGTVAWDDYEGEMPLERPHFMSELQYEHMARRAKRNQFQNSWFDKYIKYPPSSDDPHSRKLSIHILGLVSKENRHFAVTSNAVTGQVGSRRISIQHGRESSDFLINDAPNWVRFYNEFVFLNEGIIQSAYFKALVVSCIIIAGILVGIQSYPVMQDNPGLSAADFAVQVIFTSECLFTVLAEGTKPWLYWVGPERNWNNFDFWIVAIAWMPFDGGNVAFLRLLRLMRLLKLVGKVKQLQVIVEGLAKGLSSVSYILFLLLLIFYIFAVAGVNNFRENDPFHFGSLGVAMLTLFRCATLEDWSDVMFINYYGCDTQYPGAYGVYSGLDMMVEPTEQLGTHQKGMVTDFGYFPVPECWSPKRQPVASSLFFLSFVLIAAFVMLSLFVGAVCGGMSEALSNFKEDVVAARAAHKSSSQADHDLSEAMGANGTKYRIEALRDAFDSYDGDSNGEIDAAELCEMMASMGETSMMSVSAAQELITAAESDGNGTMGFSEFVKLMTGGELSASDKNKEKVREPPKQEGRRVSVLAAVFGGEHPKEERRVSLLAALSIDTQAEENERARHEADARERKTAVGLVSKVD